MLQFPKPKNNGSLTSILLVLIKKKSVTGKELINQVLYNDKRASEMEKGPKRNELCYESTNLRKD